MINKIAIIFLLCSFSSSLLHADDKGKRYSIDECFDQMQLKVEKIIEVFAGFKKSLSENSNIEQKAINTYKGIVQGYNDDVYLLNSIVINTSYESMCYDHAKVKRLEESFKKVDTIFYSIQTKDLDSSKARIDDIGYVLRSTLVRRVDMPSFFVSKEQMEKSPKAWEAYKALSKTLFDFEDFLRRMACGEDIPANILHVRYKEFFATLSGAQFETIAVVSPSDSPEGEFYRLLYRSLLNQYHCIYEQALALKPTNDDPILQKIINLCEHVLEQAGWSSYIVEESERERYVKALKMTGKVIVPEKTKR